MRQQPSATPTTPTYHTSLPRSLAFSYEVLTPAALNFFVSYADGAVESLWSIDQYFEFVLVLMLSTGLSFQVRHGCRAQAGGAGQQACGVACGDIAWLGSIPHALMCHLANRITPLLCTPPHRSPAGASDPGDAGPAGPGEQRDDVCAVALCGGGGHRRGRRTHTLDRSLHSDALDNSAGECCFPRKCFYSTGNLRLIYGIRNAWEGIKGAPERQTLGGESAHQLDSVFLPVLRCMVTLTSRPHPSLFAASFYATGGPVHGWRCLRAAAGAAQAYGRIHLSLLWQAPASQRCTLTRRRLSHPSSL